MKIMNIQDVTLGQYLPRRSVIHRLDPRTKIAAAFLIMLFLLSVTQPRRLLFSMAAVFLLYRLARINMLLGLRNLRPFLFLFLITVAIHAFFTEGETVAFIPYTSLAITKEGLIYGIFYSARICILIILANLLTLTTAPMSLTDAVEYFLTPLKIIKVPAHEIGMMLSIALRFFPILLAETDRIRKAQISRGATFQGPLRHKVNMISTLIVPLFVSTFRKANELAMAMDARCYSSSSRRTTLFELKFHTRDRIAFTLVFSFLIAGIIL